MLLYGTKEHELQGLQNKQIGLEVSSFFKANYDRKLSVRVANDTVCLTLCGNGQENGSVVIGTGFNMAIVIPDKNRKIIVNLEAGNFDKFNATASLKHIDEETLDPGRSLFEKAIAGKYLALYYNEKAKQLSLPISPFTTSQELSELSHNNHTDSSGKLARAILERSSGLCAAAITAIYEFLHRPQPCIFVGEGSMLWDGWQFPQNIEKYLYDGGIPKDTVQLKHVPDSSIISTLNLLLGHAA